MGPPPPPSIDVGAVGSGEEDDDLAALELTVLFPVGVAEGVMVTTTWVTMVVSTRPEPRVT